MAAIALTLAVEEVTTIKDIAEFPASLWCLFFICVAFYISIFVFIQNGSLFLSSKCVFYP